MGYRPSWGDDHGLARFAVLVIGVTAILSLAAAAFAAKGSRDIWGKGSRAGKHGAHHGHGHGRGHGHGHGHGHAGPNQRGHDGARGPSTSRGHWQGPRSHAKRHGSSKGATRHDARHHTRHDVGTRKPAREPYPNAPDATWSRYMSHTNAERSFGLGCSAGTRVRKGQQTRDGLVVLDYGMPMHHRGRFGASVFGSFRNTKQIARSVEEYARGYTQCSGRSHRSHLRIGIGTSNYGPDVSFKHGQRWGALVNRVNAWLRERGLADRVDAAGANDIEPGWRGPEATRRWVRGYASRTETPYYNYGGAAGCPPYPSCQGDWTQEDIWYVSWGSGVALPLPEIYAGSGINAEQWYRLSLYSVREHGEPMRIAGVMSQRGSCATSDDPCRGVRNKPDQAWSQLFHRLNADPRTAQPLRWATDITWKS